MASQETRSKIRQSLAETRERRKSQQAKVFELKVDCHHTSKEVFKKMHQAFYEAKLVINDMISSGDLFNYNYLKHKTVVKYDKDKNPSSYDITLSSVMHRAIIKQKQQDVVNLSKAKKRGRKVGHLRFVSECNCIPILTGPWLKIQKKGRRITIPGFPKITVYGLDQLKTLPEFELADAKFIRKASGFFIHITVMVPKKNETVLKGKSIGLDFGIKDNITTSEGEKFSCIVRESEQLKLLQKQLHRKQKGSKRYWRLRNQIGREYEHLTNQKNDAANKLVHKLLKENDCVYFQDEQLAKWKSYNRGFARVIQHSYLGRVKMRLISHQEDYESFMISRWAPTTKFCFNCESKYDISLSERSFTCPQCGYIEDRDVHAAKNALEFGRLIKKAEWLEQPSAEKRSSKFDLQQVLDVRFKSTSVKRRKKVLPL